MKNIIMDFSKDILKTALVDDGKLVEIFIDDKNSASLVGNIYVGIVKTILPNRFVFIDIGEAKNAFLSLNDKKEESLFKNSEITIKQGSEITVQVIKDASSTKGPLVTTQLSLSKNNIAIYESLKKETGVSKKITSISDRKKMKKIAEKLLPSYDYGIIMRTGSLNKPFNELKNEVDKLTNTLKEIKKYSNFIKAPAHAYKEKANWEKTILTFLKYDINKIIINDKNYMEKISLLIESLSLNIEVECYEGETPIFSEYFIQTQLEKALCKKIFLKSGGFLIIEQTEACVVIDVNTGKFTNAKDRTTTIFKTNLEAVYEIAFQLRLRNLSGMIIIDFIEMDTDEEKNFLIEQLKEVVLKDRVPVDVLGMAYLTVAQLTRKKMREPIATFLLEDCSCCHGYGKIHKK